MKKIITCLTFLFLVYFAKSQATFVSRASGNWSSPSTWTITAGVDGDGNNYPDANDDVTIATGHTVTINVSPVYTKTLTIQSTGVLNGNSKRLGIKGDFNNYGIVKNTLELYIQRSGSKIYSPSTYTASGNWWIQASCTIQAGSIINKKGAIILQNSGVGVANYGSVTLKNINGINLNGRVVAQSLSNNNIWINASGSSLFVEYNISLLPSKFTCTATSNTVTYAGLSNAVINTTYDNLTLAGNRTYTLTQSLKTNNKLVLSLTSANSFILDGCTSITIGGDFVSSAKVNSLTDDDSLIFNGNNALQTISGTTSNTFACMVINKPNLTDEVKFTRTQTITKELKMIKGTCNANNSNLVLGSNSSETAYITEISDPSDVNFTGNMVIQKFLPAKSGPYFDYFYSGLASPTQTSTVNDWDDELYISGIGPYDGIDGPAGVDGDVYNGTLSMMTYNEPGDSWDAVSGSSTALTPGLGYCLLLLDSINSSSLDGTFFQKTINTVGQPNYGDVTIATTQDLYGSNLLGNPYASPINLNSGVTHNGIDALYFIYEGDWYDVTTGIDFVIPPHQAFFVDVQSAGDVTFTEACKVADNTSEYYRQKPKYDIKLNLSSSVIARHHETRICFNDMASEKYDRKLDARYIPSPAKGSPAIYSLDEMNQTKIMKNSVNDANDELAIPLGIFMPKAGVYYINSSIVSLGNYNYAWIENKKTGLKYDLNNDIAIEGNNAETNTDYVLHLTKKRTTSSVAPAIVTSDLIIFSSENTINFKSSFTDYQLTQVLIYDMSGKLVLETNNVSVNANQTTKMDVSSLANGLYIVKAIDNLGNVKTSKLYK